MILHNRNSVQGGGSIEIVKLNMLAAISGRNALASRNATKIIKEVNG
jgi:hypothetical protein